MKKSQILLWYFLSLVHYNLEYLLFVLEDCGVASLVIKSTILIDGELYFATFDILHSFAPEIIKSR